ncbi:MAG: hypothetical protein WDO68_31965 [Gammaproteobacteria bacterium]
MARNPYEPPGSPLSESGRRGEPPKQVIWSVWLMRISLVVGYASLFLVQDLAAALGDVPADTRSASVVFFFVMLALTAVVYLWLIQNVKDGRNWARIVMLMLTALGLFSMLVGGESAPTVVRVISVLDTIIDITAIVLIFKPPGADWFRNGRA